MPPQTGIPDPRDAGNPPLHAQLPLVFGKRTDFLHRERRESRQDWISGRNSALIAPATMGQYAACLWRRLPITLPCNVDILESATRTGQVASEAADPRVCWMAVQPGRTASSTTPGTHPDIGGRNTPQRQKIMAMKADLEARETDCVSLQDYTDLAREALQDPKDPEYAKHLLEQAEMQCQFPADYIQVAEVAITTDDKEMAENLYQQAEEFCMEGQEFAELANSLAAHTDHKDKARELLERAVKESSKPEEILAYAGYAKSALADEALAASLMSRLGEQLKTLDDYKALAAKVLAEQQDTDAARMLYQQAANLGEGPTGAVEFATGLVELFGDKKGAAELLSSVEGECMFPGQFVALAEGFKTLLDDLSLIHI